MCPPMAATGPSGSSNCYQIVAHCLRSKSRPCYQRSDEGCLRYLTTIMTGQVLYLVTNTYVGRKARQTIPWIFGFWLQTIIASGSRYSSVDLSTPTILWPWVRSPSKNLCLYNLYQKSDDKRTKMNKKRPGLVHLKRTNAVESLGTD